MFPVLRNFRCSSIRLRPLRLPIILTVVVCLCAFTCRKAEETNLSVLDESVRNPSGAAHISATSSVFAPRQHLVNAVDDLSLDGWDSERHSRVAAKQLKQMASFLSQPKGDETVLLADLTTDDFVCHWVPRRRLVQVLDDSQVKVFRVDKADVDGNSSIASINSSPRLEVMLAEFREPLVGNARVSTKVIGISTSPEGYSTDVLVQAYGKSSSGSLQVNSRWFCRWASSAESNEYSVAEIRVTDHEEVAWKSLHPTIFRDVTQAVFRHENTYHDQLARGIDHWMQRIPTALGISPWGDCGLALGDANSDGLDDVYLCQPGGLPNRLYLHQPDGTLRCVEGESGVDWLDDTRSALFVDLDNDGDQDLVIGSREFLMLMENDGGGRFRLRADFREARDAFSLAAADYDNDGNVDVYVCRYYSDGVPNDVGRSRFSMPIPYHDARNGPPNVLLRNNGDWSFADVTTNVGMGGSNSRWSYAAAWEDYDQDGDPDLYVANDFGPNNFYRNDAGSFVDIAAATGTLDASTGMSVDWGDYDHDGWLDLYVGNMFSAAGHRVMSQHQFRTEMSRSLLARYKHLAKGNSLFRNQAGGRMQDVTLQAAVHMGRWAWSSNFVDVNNDGWEDIVIANGYYSGENKDDL